jgi:hypothetical protein
VAPKAVIAAATAFLSAETCPGDIPAGTADDQFDGWLFASARFLPKAENEVENVETVKPGFPSVRSLTGRAGGVFHFSARKISGSPFSLEAHLAARIDTQADPSR